MHLFRRARIPLACLPASASAGLSRERRLFEPWLECDITVDGNIINAVTPAASSSANLPSTDLHGRLVFPGFVDAHTHLDKCHTWHRAPNPTGEFWDAIEVLRADTANWSEDDLHARACFGLRQAWAHGTVALRTHLDSGSDVGRLSHAILAELRREWAGRVTVQTVSLCNLSTLTAAQSERVLNVAVEHGATVLGGFPQPNPDLPKQLDHLLSAAREIGLGLDLHVDESGLGHAECLRATAEAVLRHEFPHPVTCGHCCSLAVHDPARAASTIDLVKQAGIAVIALPLCNQYLQDRGRAPSAPDAPRGARRTPFWRGLTLAHELLDAGVPFACASDNVRDAFYAWGEFDMLEVFVQSVRIGQLDTRLAVAPAIVTRTAATIMGLPDTGRIESGARADFVVTSAPTFNELLARPSAPRRLIHGEAFRTAEPPDFGDLPASVQAPSF